MATLLNDTKNLRNIDKLDKILDAAEEILSEKSLEDSSIVEIAKKAGIAYSLIYNYFKGKEDLLFSIPKRRMKYVLTLLSEQLQGILDPINKLSKTIWFHLHFNNTYRGYAHILLLECRANRNFYKHEAYALIRKYSGIVLGILEDGVKKQIFRADLDLHLVRDIIFGLLDLEILSCIASKEINDTAPDFENILDLIFPMIIDPTKSADTDLDKSKRILMVAESVFAEKGYHQATISEIAKLSNVSEGTIYQYFKNKDDLLFSIPERRFKEHIASLEEIYELKNPLRKLRRLIRYHFLLYLSEPNFLKVFLFSIQFNQKFYNSPVHTIFQRYTKIIDNTLEEGKKDGSIRSEVNNRLFRNMFLGTMSHIALRWLLLEKEKETDKMKEVDEVVSLLVRAVAKKSGSNTEDIFS